MASLPLRLSSSPLCTSPKPTKPHHISSHLHPPPFSKPLKFLPLLSPLLLSPLPSLAADLPSQSSDKINLEAIVVAVDDFNNRNPFFVAGLTFIWLVVIPLTESYFKKYKPVSAISAFKKLRDEPCAQLLDIRDGKSLAFLGSPNLRLIKKEAVQVQYSESDEDGFVKRVMEKFDDPPNTVLCIMDSFDGNSLKVAELLHKKGFQAAYAIRGGVSGKKGWQEIQETLLPPSVHIYPKKKERGFGKGVNGSVSQSSEDKIAASTNSDPQIKEEEKGS